ncbi:site-specific DNA-methyltransferase [Peptostreptococcus canis]|uniref:Site-specific DNA-methyltransferase n=1 Tax=Peptostreptococcus canis TaxID=1159213 RepID=A0ABR6TIL1_9FIRM|nr:site-specific DNA-methyltransferase [Peptostreptococcus canis]MBC2575251.1 site-specific DNA-methyltransferase [Peptostreptococcus canis]MBP1997567.1 adenine specific DNA methylase Mod [Peptostreptococcus canis]
MIKDNILYNESTKPNSREIEVLKNTFPQYFDKDGNFYWDRFKEILKNEEISLNKEGYELNFLGKSYARYLSSTRTETFIAPHTEHNEAEENKDSENLYIIGDNLDALKHLLGSYAGKIKCIYIDPPYNTGSDGFVYPDNFYFDAKKLSKMIGVEEEEADRIINLKGKSSHSAWMSFIYPRLILARELLSEDGVIFISIDYNEQANLKLICDEIYGEENFVGEIYWESKTKSQNTQTSYNKLQPKAEKIFVYKRKSKDRFNLIEKGQKEYPFTDEQGEYREHILEEMNSEGIRGRETMVFDITDGVSTVSPNSGKQWKLGQDQVSIYKESNNLFIRDGKVVIKMRPYFERTSVMEPFWGFIDKSMGTTESAKKDLKKLMECEAFDTVKPINLIKKLIFHATNKEDIILDFFSGSGTTAHAVMNLNAEDGGNRKYILVQIPELIKEDKPAYKEGHRTIDEIGRERIRRAAKKIQEEAGADIDYGFKVYSLKSLEEEVITNLDYFDDNPKLFLDDMVGIFDTEKSKGKDAILSTYLALDGYGLSVNTQKYRLSNFEADKIKNSIYMIDNGLDSDDVMELIKRIETLELDITRVVVYAPSLSFHALHELKKNLSNLRNNKSVELIERY